LEFKEYVLREERGKGGLGLDHPSTGKPGNLESIQVIMGMREELIKEQRKPVVGQLLCMEVVLWRVRVRVVVWWWWC
jgi:hypothetical protein